MLWWMYAGPGFVQGLRYGMQISNDAVPANVRGARKPRDLAGSMA